MISICIPTYNTDCSTLLKVLHNQIQDVEYNIEVIVLEDGSTAFVHDNVNVCEKFGFIHVKNEKNLGRANSRVKLAKKSNHPWLLFIDADMKPSTDNFILNYVRQTINKRPYDVFIGGHCYENLPNIFNLRLRYGKAREEATSEERNKNPFKNIFFGNMMIKKEVFLSIFSSYTNCAYGEDLFLSAMLRERRIKVLHIDNNTFHLGLEKNHQFLKKTEEAAETIAHIHNNKRFNLEYSKLLRYYSFLKRLYLIKPVYFIFKILIPTIRRTLIWFGGPLLFIDLYRLHFFLKHKK